MNAEELDMIRSLHAMMDQNRRIRSDKPLGHQHRGALLEHIATVEKSAATADEIISDLLLWASSRPLDLLQLRPILDRALNYVNDKAR